MDCAWPVTATLAVCSECMPANVITSFSSNSTCEVTTFSLPPFYDQIPPIGANVTHAFCDKNTKKEFNESAWKIDIASPNSIFSSPESYPLISDSTNFTIANLYSFGTDEDSFVFSGHNCSFHFCLKGYSARVSPSGLLQQASPIVASQSCPVYRNATDLNDIWWKLENIPEELNAEPDDEYMIPDQLRYVIEEALTGALSGEVGFEKRIDGNAKYQILPTVEALRTASDSLANLTTLVQSISDGLTSYIRTNGPEPPPDSRYALVVGTTVSVIVVRWIWLLYAIALQIGGLVFLGLTVCLTRRRRMLPWKGQRVPLLLAKLDETVQARAQGALASPQGYDDSFGELHVCLEFDGDNGLAFRRTYGSRLQTLGTESESSSQVPLHS